MITIYGIKNCDTVKKARRWLDEHGHTYHFHDYRSEGIDEALLKRLEAAVGWDALLNRRGTTWRKLAESDRDPLDRDKAMSLMLAYPAVIKRPVLDAGGKMLIGFSSEYYASEL